MGIMLFLPLTALAAFLVGLDRRGKGRILAFVFGSLATAVWLWVVVALVVVNRPFCFREILYNQRWPSSWFPVPLGLSRDRYIDKPAISRR